ncbi:quinoprotein relay system zinc metallohydrolase 1 [Limnobacter sp.]|uniref:quinoprotein relay system zinc metallohydrolase 1 n=1 Tax=Limnobacter sp. TaxID=2003368 RepID=UPI002E368FE6|nr:quinoprotein relay system zinc metallohydrolase 1 [Limnobacter sp.]
MMKHSRTPHQRLAVAMLAALLTTATGAIAANPTITPPTPNAKTLNYGLNASPLGDGWYVIEGQNADFSVDNGCNIINTGFFVKDNKVWVINTGTSRLYGEQQRALIEKTTHQAKIQEVINLNLHPDYFLGNQAYADTPIAATAVTQQGMHREASAYETNLYKLCGDWMKGTESRFPDQTVKAPGQFDWSGRQFETMELSGHTDSDLVIFDREHGVLWSGGLVFHDRIITVPHAHLKAWMESLKTLKKLNPKIIIPSHGPVAFGTGAIDQTLDYITWLDQHLKQSADAGLDINEVMDAGVPDRFKHFAAYPAEFYRNVTKFYPQYERAALGGFR